VWNEKAALSKEPFGNWPCVQAAFNVLCLLNPDCVLDRQLAGVSAGGGGAERQIAKIAMIAIIAGIGISPQISADKR